MSARPHDPGQDIHEVPDETLRPRFVARHPGATATVLFAINDEGVAVGRYASAGRTHGVMRSATGGLITIDFPGAGFTVAGAVNNRGGIVGWYTLPAASAIRVHQFRPAAVNLHEHAGDQRSWRHRGRFCTRTMCREPGSGDFHGFVLRDGAFTILDIPGSIETNVWKVNNRGEILGGYGGRGRRGATVPAQERRAHHIRARTASLSPRTPVASMRMATSSASSATPVRV